MLQVAVHHSYKSRLARKRTFHASAGEAAASHAPNTANATVKEA